MTSTVRRGMYPAYCFVAHRYRFPLKASRPRCLHMTFVVASAPPSSRSPGLWGPPVTRVAPNAEARRTGSSHPWESHSRGAVSTTPTTSRGRKRTRVRVRRTAPRRPALAVPRLLPTSPKPHARTQKAPHGCGAFCVLSATLGGAGHAGVSDAALTSRAKQR
jgi:hypothetical protein